MPFYPGHFLTTRFDRLGRGEEFDLSATAPSGPYVKVGDGLYALLNGAGPTDNGRFQPFGAVTDITGVVRYFTPPALSINGARQVVTPRPASGLTYYSSIDSQGAANQGADPVLGPPFAPVFYQLFIDAPSTYATTGGAFPAHLYWTVPALDVLVIKRQIAVPLRLRVWFGLVNDITQATRVDVFQDGIVGTGRYLYPSNYLWIAYWPDLNTPPATPVGAGTAVPGGTSFNGFATANFNGSITFLAHAVVTWGHFELRRSRGDSNFSDATNLGIPALIGVGTTITSDFTTPAVGSSVSIAIADSSLVSNGQLVVINTAGVYTITAITDGTHITVQSVAATANAAVGTVIASGNRVAPAQTADDYSDRDANTNYFYELRGKLNSTSLLDYVHFNIVGLIHPYVLDPPKVIKDSNGIFQKTTLTWNAPTAAELAAWPTTPA